MVIAVIVTLLFLVFFAQCAFAILKGPRKCPLQPTAQQLEAGDASDGCSPTDVDPPMYAQDEKGSIFSLPPPAGTQDGEGNTLVLPPPAVTQDERGNTLVLPPPAVMRNKDGYNSGCPHSQSSTSLPMYIDGSDR